mgnify:CR=1 FL=1
MCRMCVRQAVRVLCCIGRVSRKDSGSQDESGYERERTHSQGQSGGCRVM